MFYFAFVQGVKREVPELAATIALEINTTEHYKPLLVFF
jgi:hypothetical protein